MKRWTKAHILNEMMVANSLLAEATTRALNAEKRLADSRDELARARQCMLDREDLIARQEWLLQLAFKDSKR
jgi:hypothetical protein